MSSPVHPFQPYRGDNANRPPNQLPPYATGGYVVYMNSNDGGAAPPPSNGATNAYGAPNNTSAYPPDGSNLQGNAYGAPPHPGYPDPGQPGGAQGYPYGMPGAQGYLVAPPGAQMFATGTPNPAGYNPPSSSQAARQAPGYQPRSQDGQAGVPTYSTGAPIHNHIYQTSAPANNVQGEQGYSPAIPAYPPGDPNYLARYPVYLPNDPGQPNTPAAYSPSATGYPAGVGAYPPGMQYPPGNGGMYGYPMPAMNGAPGATQGNSGASPGVTSAAAYPPSAGSPASAPGFGIGASSAVYPVPANHQLDNNKNTLADQQLGKYPPPQHLEQQTNGQQPPPVNPRDLIETGRWAAGLCSCCDSCIPNCMMAMCLPFISLAQIYARMGLIAFAPGLLVFFILYAITIAANFLPNTTETTTVRYSYGGYTSYQTVAYSAPNPLAWPLTVAGFAGQLAFRLFVWRARAAIRGRYNIPGSCCGDCCAVYWCSCCAVAQMATHVKSYKPGSCGIGAPATLPAYGST